MIYAPQREWDVRVAINAQSASAHVRAFLVHKRLSERMEILEMQPALADTRPALKLIRSPAGTS